ncbi:MAG TPA: UDP-N-acetylmuramate dehydrogenase [Candidatus Paceibacterota bacterium]
MQILENYDLTGLNTFRVPARAKFFVEVKNEAEFQELRDLPEFKNNKKFFLGGGSNVLFTADFDGIVVLNKLKGIDILSEDEAKVRVKCMSGEVWHDLVNFTVDRNYWGIENLAYIPGTVGAAPMQNIGAYGAELKDVLEGVEICDLKTGKHRVFSREECRLGYRDSIFKNELQDKYFVISITLCLSKKEKKNISYKILREYLEQNKVEVKKSKDVSDAVTAIRKSKLPDPAVIGNAGSFFKNVFISKEKLREMKKIYPDMPSFEEDGAIKIPAAWFVEMCGWKGKRVGNAGVHDRQALVLVNHGNATGQEIKVLADQVINSVFEKFGIKLVPEVNLI